MRNSVRAVGNGALAVAGGRVLLGLAALVRPQWPAQAWLGSEAADQGSVRVLGRALGGRDLAIGIGTLCALGSREPGSRYAAAWLAAGALADAVDAAATVAAWRSLPRGGRGMVVTAAGGSALIGALAASEQMRG